MGWVSLLEDTLEKIQENIARAEAALKEDANPSEEHRTAGLKALKDAQAILDKAWQHLELATSPELEFAHEIKKLEEQNKALEHKLKVAEHKVEKAEYESANHYAELQDANREVAKLKKEKRKVEKEFEKVARRNPAAAMEVFSARGMMKKHKPNP